MVMIAALASMVMLGCSEGIAALVSLVSIALYYAILGALHKRISKKIVFTINKI